MEAINTRMAGERVTFLQLLQDKNFTIEIPIIQRDFAQGRKSTAEIRELFLETLYDHLSNDVNIDLDFIYGSLSAELKGSKRFIPLDGQQRLTTLFLLHWYLANKEDRKANFRKSLLLHNKPRFTYETRSSSREFCEALISKEIDFTQLSEDFAISDLIRNKPWYYQSWNLDPTINGMLIMLDDIHEMFCNTSGFYELLVRNENPVITFLFLNLEEFKLTDDLYIKMNARGKPLTEFENFKAKFEQIIRSMDLVDDLFSIAGKKSTPLEYFSNRIDTNWSDLFWNFRNKKTNVFDDELMNFIRVTATNHYASVARRELAINSTNLLRERGDYGELTKVSFSKYEEIGCLTPKYIYHIIKLLDRVTHEDGSLERYLDDKFYYDELRMFERVHTGLLSLPDSLQFYGYALYLTSCNDNAGLFDWMRVIHNLTTNTTYNAVDEYVASIRSITRMGASCDTIVNYLTLETNIVDSFLGIQINEERVKAHLLLKSEDWRRAILAYEHHGYFKGQIGFILKFAGILDYYNAHKHCKWPAEEDDVYFNQFNYYGDCAEAVFTKNGLKEFDNCLWERALLTKGNYLLEKGPNYSFLKNEDRDVSWKRLLRDNNGNKRNIVKVLFDDEYFDIGNVAHSLSVIITNFGVIDWRYYIIRNPETIRYCSQRMIRFGTNSEVILLGQSQLNHYHVDLHTYSLYYNYLNGVISEYWPFTSKYYEQIKSADDTPSIVFLAWTYNGASIILYIYCQHNTSEPTYQFQISDRLGNPLPLIIKCILDDHSFRLASNGPYLLQVNSEIETLNMLKTLCTEFIELA